MGGGGGYEDYPQYYKESSYLVNIDNKKNLIKNNKNAHITHSKHTKIDKCAQRGNMAKNCKKQERYNLTNNKNIVQSSRKRKTAKAFILWLLTFVFFFTFWQNNFQSKPNVLDISAASDQLRITAYDYGLLSSFDITVEGSDFYTPSHMNDDKGYYWYTATSNMGNFSNVYLTVTSAPNGFKWKNVDSGDIYDDPQIKTTVKAVGMFSIRIELVKVVNPTTLTISCNVTCDNSMLLLTIVDNNKDVVQEIGFVSGQNENTAVVELTQNTTYEILVTKPFGSTISVTGATNVSPTIWKIDTGSNKTLSATFNLSGNGKWSNTVVI